MFKTIVASLVIAGLSITPSFAKDKGKDYFVAKKCSVLNNAKSLTDKASFEIALVYVMTRYPDASVPQKMARAVSLSTDEITPELRLVLRALGVHCSMNPDDIIAKAIADETHDVMEMDNN